MSQPMSSHERSQYCEILGNSELSASQAACALFKEFARERPEVAALWIFGLGFVLGWKLKPW